MTGGKLALTGSRVLVGVGGESVGLGVALGVDVASAVGVTERVGGGEGVIEVTGVRVGRVGVWLGETRVALSAVPRSPTGVVVP